MSSVRAGRYAGPLTLSGTICSENVRCQLRHDPTLIAQTLRFVQSLPKRERVPFSQKFRNADPLAIDLLEKMLVRLDRVSLPRADPLGACSLRGRPLSVQVFDPRKRINAAEALAHPYLAPYHDPTDEPAADEPFDWCVRGPRELD